MRIARLSTAAQKNSVFFFPACPSLRTQRKIYASGVHKQHKHVAQVVRKIYDHCARARTRVYLEVRPTTRAAI